MLTKVQTDYYDSFTGNCTSVRGYQADLPGKIGTLRIDKAIQCIDLDNPRFLSVKKEKESTGGIFAQSDAIDWIKSKQRDFPAFMDALKDSGLTRDPVDAKILPNGKIVIFEGFRRTVAYSTLNAEGIAGFDTIPVRLFDPAKLTSPQEAYLISSYHVVGANKKSWEYFPQFSFLRKMLNAIPDKDRDNAIRMYAVQVGLSTKKFNLYLERVEFMEQIERKHMIYDPSLWAACGRVIASKTYIKAKLRPTGKLFEDLTKALADKLFSWTGKWNGAHVDFIFGNPVLRKAFMTDGGMNSPSVIAALANRNNPSRINKLLGMLAEIPALCDVTESDIEYLNDADNRLKMLTAAGNAIQSLHGLMADYPMMKKAV